MSDSEKSDQEAFDTWHKKKCNIIIDLIKTEKSEKYDYEIVKGFTYGQAQKWLNMTLKYLWLFNLLPAGLDEKLLHVPVDSYIIDAVKAEPSSDIKYGLGQKCNIPSWSKWADPDKYKEYQNNIKTQVEQQFKEEFTSPIEWEGKAWIEQAEKRNKKEKQAKRDSFFKENNPQE